MRIQSKQKDYYDYISHLYGADPNCVYLRGKLPETRLTIPDRLPTTDLLDFDKTRGKIHVSFIVAGSMAFWFVGRSLDFATIEWFPYDPALHDGWFARPHGGRARTPPTYGEEQLKALVRAVGAPVFHVTEIELRCDGKPGRVVHVAPYPPVLQDFGIASLVAPEQMWQNIYTTLTSVLRRDPDKEPPLVVGNDERVLAAGFDLKSSFRHPVNPRKL